MSIDMLLDERFQPVSRVNGDAVLVADSACFLQALRMEAAGSEGDLWYAPAWGWSLLDFKDAVQDELTMLEMTQRVRQKLALHAEISVESIQVTAEWVDDSVVITVVFRLLNDGQLARLNVNIGKTEIEVIVLA